jgi:Restriction endonuclease fold toxin 7
VLEDSFRTAVRLEMSRLDSRFADMTDVGGDSHLSALEVVARTLAGIRQRDAAKAGKLGERVARVPARKRRIPSASGTACFRVPDILTDTELIEVKNVRHLRLTPQLADFDAYARSKGLTFVLLTRFDTTLTPELTQLIQVGQIVHRQFSGLLSQRGRHLIRGLIADAVASDQVRR